MVPAPDIVTVLSAVALFCMVIALVTLRVTPVLTVKLPPKLPKSILLADAFAVTVTVLPPWMTTSSFTPGTPPLQPVHVPAVLQLPLPFDVQVSAYADVTGSAASAIITIMSAAAILVVKVFVFMVLLLL
jgi:hypothetical protein